MGEFFDILYTAGMVADYKIHSLSFNLVKKPVAAVATHAVDFHAELINRIQSIINPGNQKDLKPLFESIREKNYSKALRRACTSKDPLVFEIIKVLVPYRKSLNFNINEQAGADNLGALHYAAKSNHGALYDYLVAEGADETIKDAKGLTPKQYKSNTVIASGHGLFVVNNTNSTPTKVVTANPTGRLK
jgi:hypothetical protein